MLYDELTKINSDRDWSFILRQLGMFSFTGLTPAQVTDPGLSLAFRFRLSIVRDFRIKPGCHIGAACNLHLYYISRLRPVSEGTVCYQGLIPFVCCQGLLYMLC